MLDLCACTLRTDAAPRALAPALAALDPDAMSPREALAALYEIRRIAADGGA